MISELHLLLNGAPSQISEPAAPERVLDAMHEVFREMPGIRCQRREWSRLAQSIV